MSALRILKIAASAIMVVAQMALMMERDSWVTEVIVLIGLIGMLYAEARPK